MKVKSTKKSKKATFKKLPDRAELLVAFTYDCLSGELIRKSTGKPTGYQDTGGYIRVYFKKRIYMAHRIVYKMFHGKDPGNDQIDHCDGNPSNNRIENLRCVKASVNCRNRAKAREKNGVPKGASCGGPVAEAIWKDKQRHLMARIKIEGPDDFNGY